MKVNDKSVHLSGQLEQVNQTKYGLIIDGQTLQYALEYPLALEFLQLAKSCQVVVCCRAAPVQKVITSSAYVQYLLTCSVHKPYLTSRNTLLPS